MSDSKRTLRFWARLPQLSTWLVTVLVAVGVFLILLPQVSGEVAKSYWLLGVLSSVAILVLARRPWVVPASARRCAMATREGKALLQETRALLKRGGKRLEGSIVQRIEDAEAELQRHVDGVLGGASSKAQAGAKVSRDDDVAARGRRKPVDIDQMVKALRKLDELADRYLATHRKSTFVEYAESIGIAVLLAFFLRTFVVEAFKIPSGSMIPTLMVGDHIFVNKYIYGVKVPLTNTKVLDFRPPHRGEVVVFIKPGDSENRDYIKRVVGTGGDTIVLRDQVLTRIVPRDGPPIDVELHKARDHVSCGERSDPSVILDPSDECVLFAERIGDDWHPVLYRRRIGSTDLVAEIADAPEETMTVADGHVFCMGDNRDNSSDSRYWGDVPLDHVKGRAIAVWWSFGDPWQRWERFGLPVK